MDALNERQAADRLDNPAQRAAADPGGMLRSIEELPEQCRAAVQLAHEAPLPGGLTLQQVMVLGMGGSAIGGDLLRALVADRCPVPIQVNREYSVPASVGAGTLVIAASYSGNTEETLQAADEAASRGAFVIAITTGGLLAQRAQAAGWPLLRIPGGLQPRAALGYAFLPLVVLCQRLGLIPDVSADLEESIAVLSAQRQRLGGEVPTAQNPAKQLALQLYGKLPLIYGSGGWRGVAAYRWKTQINENAKAPAVWNTFPELNHNETVGWEVPEAVTRQFQVVVLRDQEDPAPIRRRIEVTSQIMAPHVAGISEVWAEGRSPLARLLSLIYPGDFASCYLAYLYGVDPSPVRVIDYLKSQLRQGS